MTDKRTTLTYIHPDPQTMQVMLPSVFVCDGPGYEARAVSELVYGELFTVHDTRDDWAYGQCQHDDYVGFVPLHALSDDVMETTLTVSALRTPVFREADFKSPVECMLGFGSRVNAMDEAGDYIAMSTGWLYRPHVTPRQDALHDFATRFIGTPYVWGGRSGFGTDCSGLVQQGLMAMGLPCPRDSDMQQAALGQPVQSFHREDFIATHPGDLLFFPGHVAIVTTDDHVIHADAHHMAVVREPVADVVSRKLKDGETGLLRRLHENSVETATTQAL